MRAGEEVAEEAEAAADEPAGAAQAEGTGGVAAQAAEEPAEAAANEAEGTGRATDAGAAEAAAAADEAVVEAPAASNVALQKFAGSWAEVVEESDSLEPIMVSPAWCCVK